VVGEIRLSTISERELTINVLKQQWKKENNKGTFRMKFLKLFLAYFFFSTGVKAQTEKTLINRVCFGHDITISWN
jgi:cell division protein FtsB